jgi:hypothetical protein
MKKVINNIGKLWFIIIYVPIYILLNILIDLICWIKYTNDRWRGRI